jgi:hypothetical protein
MGTSVNEGDPMLPADILVRATVAELDSPVCIDISEAEDNCTVAGFAMACFAMALTLFARAPNIVSQTALV